MEPQPSARSCRRGAAPAAPCELLAAEPPMNLCINTTTGARYELSVPGEETVEGLRRRLSQRLKVPKERLALLYKETRLSSGKLQDLGVGDGSKVTLVPTVEAGLMSQASRPEQSVMQALESLTETQVSDFLSGRSPLTLALRVGDHMMFVQLQLAAQQAAAGAQLQHRQHLMAGRGDPGATASTPSPCRPSSLTAAATARVPVPACPPSPSATSSTPAYFSPAHPSPVTAGVFRSHGASAQTVNGGAVSSCSEVDCASHSSSTSPSPSSSSSASSSLGSSSPPSSSPAPSTRSRKPGAVIESFVNHAPGVFSGTFSGTLHPNCQDSSGRPRRDIGTILQILNDLLSATRHYQGMPQSLAQLRCQTQCSPSPELTTKATSCEKLTSPLHSVVQSQIRMCKPSGDRLRQTENRATRCKVERLQLLLQQKRLRRKARRDARGPYHWLSGRKAGRAASSSSSGSSSGASDAGGLDLDFEDSLWKPEVKADLKSEFVVA
ncbi:midnolin [Sminthopsis crassicaudata]|uniref:midnolin n=1 Tax=Sminthopsis crassicaudata TaxID=9301 RepID=UPI003D69B1FD